MINEKENLVRSGDTYESVANSRRAFLQRAALGGAVGAASLCGVLAMTAPASNAMPAGYPGKPQTSSEPSAQGDHDILVAAQIAETLAVTTYSHIIDIAPFFKNLADDDQGYLIAANQEEMSHYLLEKSVTGLEAPFKSFFYPKGMFEDAQTTLNVLVTLEDAFIAAYLVGVRNFSTPDLRVTAARIMGIESNHRTLARVVGPGVAKQDGGPIEKITGVQGVAEKVDPPNNNKYERTLCWTDISQAVTALTPFLDINAAKSAGFDVSRSFGFRPFTPKLPNALGDFISFKGC